jgi:hypothetical protein
VKKEPSCLRGKEKIIGNLASNQSVLLPFYSCYPQGVAMGTNDCSVVDYGRDSVAASQSRAWADDVADSQHRLEGKLQPDASDHDAVQERVTIPNNMA